MPNIMWFLYSSYSKKIILYLFIPCCIMCMYGKLKFCIEDRSENRFLYAFYFNSLPYNTKSATESPIDKEDVAAGDGALSTLIVRADL